MKFTRRQTLAAALGSLGAGVLPRAQAQTQPFPSQVIKFVIPTPAGGGHDTMMRIIGQKLTDAWGQPCIVESRSGASGAIAAATVSQAPADGYTVLISYSALLSITVLMPKPGYRLEDLQPVGMLALTPIAFGVRESLPASTLKQYVALAKTRPGKLSYGSYGPGSGGHFVGELFNMAAGIDTVHVPYKGEPPALQDLIGGQIDAAVVSVGGVNRYPGKIKPLAVASATRFPSYPDVPTFADRCQRHALSFVSRRADLRRTRLSGGRHAGLGRRLRAGQDTEGDRGQAQHGDGPHPRDAGCAREAA